MKYRKKPVIIEATQLLKENLSTPLLRRKDVEIIDIDTNGKILKDDEIWARIRTLEGVMIADNGDFIVQGVKGELYPCKPDIFRATYERVEE